MKVRLLGMLFNFYSISAVAGYECHLQLAHSEDLYKVIAEKTVQVSEGNLVSRNFGTLFIESQTNRKKVSLDVNAVMDGMHGAEDATFVIIRRTTKKRSVSSATISEVMTVTGDSKKVGWFDSYKLDISCRIIE